MATTSSKTPIRLTPDCAGVLLTPREFDRAEYEEGWRNELINGVLVITPYPALQERDKNDELGYLLRSFATNHPNGKTLDATLPDEEIKTGRNRRRVDRVIWCGLGRLPKKNEKPSIIVEFVSPGKRAAKRDYEEKRDEYMAINVQEYWIIDRFERTMTVYTKKNGRNVTRVFKETQVYKTPLLPGFELPLARLFALADEWEQ